MSAWTKERHEAARARCKGATTGPWKQDRMVNVGANWMICDCGDGDEIKNSYIVTTDNVPCSQTGGGCAEGDSEFVAHSRTDLPDALDEIERVTEKLTKAQDGLRVLKDGLPEAQE